MPKKDTITRRDFLDGAAISIVAAALPGTAAFAQTSNGPLPSDYYPPTLTGMRGNHPGSFDAAHPLAWNGEAPSGATDTGEEYDLVVVGGGLSGLAAALFYQREAGADKRVLILDNHDDFGGHAKRNEFEVGGRMLLGVGGSVNLESAPDYSKTVKQLLKEIGVDLEKLEGALHPDDPMVSYGAFSGIYIDGAEGPVVGAWRKAFAGKGDYESLINQLPMPQVERDKLIKLASGKWDYLVGHSINERITYLTTTSYHTFLKDKVGLAPEYVTMFDPMLRILFGCGGDGVSVQEALFLGVPGLGSVGWPWGIAQNLFAGFADGLKILQFPDGNATLARLMVRKLIPDVAPGANMDDVATARFDYSKLDVAGATTRIRLNATVINAEERNDEVTVAYVQGGTPYRVKGKHCVMACYNSIIPHLCPALPEDQKEALKYGVKIPLLWANVALKNGSAFHKAGAHLYECPNRTFGVVTRAPMTQMDDYQAPLGEDDPLLLFLMGSQVPQKEPGQSARDQYRLARHQLLATPFSDFEDDIRDQLTGLFGAHGFDADRDIEAITVNRWAHGYAYEYLELDDDFEEGVYPHELGRKQFGRISIANSDAGGKAYLYAAIDQAWRAVEEQLAG